MAQDRLDLHQRLIDLFPDLTVYYRPPSQLILKYPCVVYDRKRVDGLYSNNAVYASGSTFQVSILSVLPGYESVKRMLDIPGSESREAYITSDIVHDVFYITLKPI